LSPPSGFDSGRVAGHLRQAKDLNRSFSMK
jgi:hypothetical protein